MKIPFDLSSLTIIDLYRLGSFIMGFDDEQARQKVCPTAILKNVNPPAAAILGRTVADEIIARESGASTGVKSVKLIPVHPDADPKVRDTYRATIWYWFKSWRKATAASDMPELAAVLKAGEDAAAAVLKAQFTHERELTELLFGGTI